MSAENKIKFETSGCGGCRTCELACSYHHKKVFSPAVASIEITNSPENLGFAVSFYSSNAGTHLACDKCEKEEEPQCLKYCSALERDEMKVYLQESFSRKIARAREET